MNRDQPIFDFLWSTCRSVFAMILFSNDATFRRTFLSIQGAFVRSKIKSHLLNYRHSGF